MLSPVLLISLVQKIVSTYNVKIIYGILRLYKNLLNNEYLLKSAFKKLCKLDRNIEYHINVQRNE